MTDTAKLRHIVNDRVPVPVKPTPAHLKGWAGFYHWALNDDGHDLVGVQARHINPAPAPVINGGHFPDVDPMRGGTFGDYSRPGGDS